MTARKMRMLIGRRFAIAWVLILAGSVLAVPAGAQFFDDRYPFDQRSRRQQVQPRESFPFFFGDRGPFAPFNPNPRPQQPVESTKAPPPRKQETVPSSTVLVIGDSLADWLGYGLEETLADTPEIGVVRKIRPISGLVRYEPRSDTPEWSQAVKEMLAAEKPSAIVVMLGLNDRLPLRERPTTRPQPAAPGSGQGASQAPQSSPPAESEVPSAQPGQPPSPSIAATDTQHPAATYEFQTDKWAELYGRRVDDMIAALKSKGVPVLWVGLPAMRGARATTEMSYLDEIYRARAEKAGAVYVDVWEGFVDESGHYAVQGPDFEGQTRRLRTGDGVHFTKPGAVKLAHYVARELRRTMSNRPVPVALPSPDDQTKAAAGTRPDAGPVVPLNSLGNVGGTDLLGGDSRPTAARSDPIATRVLGRGDAIAAPAGRADDFRWPRIDAGAKAATDGAVTHIAPAPAKGGADRNEAKKPADGKPADAKPPDANAKPADAKKEVAPDAGALRLRRSRVDLDGPPRPPLPVGASRD